MPAFTKYALPAALLLVAACGGPQIRVNTQQTYYLQTNLRAHGNVVTSVNEWEKQTVLQACTPVRLQWARGREIRFLVDGEAYRYIIYRGSRLGLNGHLKRVFGPSCPKKNRALSEADLAGVRQARPYTGMSKRGVIMALGYPPDHVTRTLDESPWTYWGTRGRVKIHFNGNVVSRIEGASSEPAVQYSQPPVTARSGRGQGGQAGQAGQGGQGGQPPPPPPPGAPPGSASGSTPPQGGGGPTGGGGTATGTSPGNGGGTGPGNGGEHEAIGRMCKAGDPCPDGLQCVKDERGIGHCQRAQ